MYTDKENRFSDAQAVTASAISSVIDLGATGNVQGIRVSPALSRTFGEGEELDLVIQVDEDATAAGAATVVFTLESDDQADLAGTPTVHLTSPAVAKAALVEGYQWRVTLPKGIYKRYLGVRYTVATGPLTAGKFTAFLTLDSQEIYNG